MAQIYRLDSMRDCPVFVGSSCAFGVFDGVHKGHQYLLSCAQKTAQESGGKSVALTFNIDPDELFHATRLKKLMSNERRIDMLAHSGVDVVAVLDFTPEFAALTPQDFLDSTFNGHVPSYLHVGLDFHFGRQAQGTVADLGRWGAAHGTYIDAHNLMSSDSLPITSTRIRKLLANHDLAAAEKLLGRRFSFYEKVQKGRGEGADLGFSTANLIMPTNRQVLAEGVYAAYATVDNVRYKAAVSVGVSPVFAERSTATCEVHLLDFSADIYGEYIEVEFVEYLRPMIKFDSTDELIKTVLSNIQYVRDNLQL